MFVLVRFEPETTLTEDALEIMPLLSFKQQSYLLEREDSYKTEMKEIVSSTYSDWEESVKALSRGDGEAIKNTKTNEYFGVEIFKEC